MKRDLPASLAFWGTALALFATAQTQAAPGPSGADAVLKYEEPKHLAGSIYTADGQKLLFRFDRVARRSGEDLEVQRDFTYPDGKPAAKEHVRYEGDALVSYGLEELQTGATGTATIRRTPADPEQATIEFEYASQPGAHPRAHNEHLAPNTLIADMVGPFLAAHWEALQRGERVKCRYLVVPRKETVGFTFRKDSASTWRGHEAMIVKMEPTSRFVSMLVEPLFFTIEKDPPHRVLRYVGRTTPKIQVQGKWEDLDAETIFDWNSAR